MAVFEFRKEQVLNTDEEHLWEFVSSPKNLSVITPSHMDFQILSKYLPKKAYPGQIIRYHVKPMLGIRMLWVTEITQVVENKYFVDEQRKGPYKMWHHEHHIERSEEGLKMVDIITYQPPFGFLGSIANRLFIRRQLNNIFEYREKVFDELFN